MRALPRLWAGAGGALALCLGFWLAPLIVDMSGEFRAGWSALAGLTTLVAVGAVARLSITDDVAAARALGLGPSGLQIGRPEARLLGGGLLCLIFLAMVVIVLALVVLAVFGTAELDLAAIQARDGSRIGAPWKLGLLATLAVVAVSIPLLLAARLSLFIPATLGRRQMVSLTAMSLSKGKVAELLAGLIVTAAPAIGWLALRASGAVAGSVADAATVTVLVGLQLPLTLGLVGQAYRRLETWKPSESKT